VVIVVGGHNTMKDGNPAFGDTTAIPSVEIFDVATKAWSKGPSLPCKS
jgi:hypothetical protein